MKKFEDSHVNSSGAFPDAVSINASGPSATDGTEWVKLGIDDWWGWVQALLKLAGIVPSGVTETSDVSDILNAQKSLFWFNNLITGFVCSNNSTDSEHDIDVSVGQAMDSTNSYLMKFASGLIKQIDASWAVGTNAGGMFTGSVAVDTWYAVFAIRADADGSIDVGFDTDSGAANIPGGYTAFRRIGWVLTDGSANILQFFDTELAGGGVNRQWDGIFNDFSGSTSTSRALATLTVAKNTIARLGVNKTGAVDTVSWVLPTSVTDFAPTGVADSLIRVDTGGARASIVLDVLADASSQVAYRSSTVSATIRINTIGFIDSRLV